MKLRDGEALLRKIQFPVMKLFSEDLEIIRLLPIIT